MIFRNLGNCLTSIQTLQTVLHRGWLVMRTIFTTWGQWTVRKWSEHLPYSRDVSVDVPPAPCRCRFTKTLTWGVNVVLRWSGEVSRVSWLCDEDNQVEVKVQGEDMKNSRGDGVCLQADSVLSLSRNHFSFLSITSTLEFLVFLEDLETGWL